MVEKYLLLLPLLCYYAKFGRFQMANRIAAPMPKEFRKRATHDGMLGLGMADFDG